MKSIFLISFICFFQSLDAQSLTGWFVYPGSPITGGRFEDIFFINDTTGWVCGGGKIYKTVDAGQSWQLELSTSPIIYLRSIEFLDVNTGFCGTLDHKLFKSMDGGTVWYEVTDSLPVAFDGICGMSAADDTTIYLCGIWDGPAYIFKSSDKGINWEYIDMSAYASSLVDIKFIDNLHGFVTGADVDPDLGGVILYTADGGLSWEKKINTNYNSELVWKIQILDSVNVFASIEDITATNDARMMISHDAGMSWEIKTLSTEYFNIEMVGFVNPDTGWVGGWFDGAFETFDGGETWNMNYYGENLNRFFRVNDSLSFSSGRTIYVYADSTALIDTSEVMIESMNPLIHKIDNINPNPSQNYITINYTIDQNTTINMNIFDMKGNLVHPIYHGKILAGTYSEKLEHNLPAGEYIVSMHSNERFLWKKFVVQ